jgi:hypothetical protein
MICRRRPSITVYNDVSMFPDSLSTANGALSSRLRKRRPLSAALRPNGKPCKISCLPIRAGGRAVQAPWAPSQCRRIAFECNRIPVGVRLSPAIVGDNPRIRFECFRGYFARCIVLNDMPTRCLSHDRSAFWVVEHGAYLAGEIAGVSGLG